MKLLNKLQVRPVVKVEPKPLNVDYTQYTIGTNPLLNDDGLLFFWVDNPLTRAEKRILYRTALDDTEHDRHVLYVANQKRWLKENITQLTARFPQVELPISAVISHLSLHGMYRLAKDQIDKAVELPVSTLRHDKGQYVKPSDVYGGTSDYTFQTMVVNYYVGKYKEDLEQKIEQVKTLGRYPDDWNPIDVRATRQNVPVRPKLNERFIHVYDDDIHYIRLCASLVAGLETVPVQLTYHGGSERYIQGTYSPNCILSMYASSLMESHEGKVSV